MNLTEATMKALQGKKLNESVDEDLYVGDIEKEILDATQQILEKHGIKAVRYTNLEMTEAVKFNFDNSTFVVLVDELDMVDMQDLDENKKVEESNVSKNTLNKLLTVEKSLTDCIMSTNNDELLDILQPAERNISEYLRNNKVTW